MNVNVILPRNGKKVGTNSESSINRYSVLYLLYGWEEFTASGLAEPLLSGMSLIWGLLSLCRPRIYLVYGHAMI